MRQIIKVATSIVCLLGWCAAADQPPRIQPQEARQHVGQKVEVVFEVKASKNSIKRKTVFLDSETDFRDVRNLGIAISEQGQTELKTQRHIEDAATFYRGKQIRVVGVVVLEDERPYIKVDYAEQLDLFTDR